jgi:hypothetical protein
MGANVNPDDRPMPLRPDHPAPALAVPEKYAVVDGLLRGADGLFADRAEGSSVSVLLVQVPPNNDCP